MEVLIAVGHFSGALLALVILMTILEMVSQWEEQRYGERLRQEFSIKLQVPVNELDFLEWERDFSRIMHERFSEERFQNRMADLLGTILTIWLWLAKAVMLFLYLGIAWLTFPDQLEMAFWVWSVVAAWMLFSTLGMAFSFICYLILGRYPGEPRKVRRALLSVVTERTQPGLE